MQNVLNSIDVLNTIKQNHNLECADIKQLLFEVENAKVCIPLIGKFSSGKSGLVNGILKLRNKILVEDITPETAIPTEIVYSSNKEYVLVENVDGTNYQMDVKSFRGFEADANTVKFARLYLNISTLSMFPDVMIVDMPGFESGYEIHNRAIDNYLSKSLAYIVCFPADDLTLRTSIIDILKELNLHEMPLCVVITKYDKHKYDFEETFEYLKNQIKEYVNNKNIKYCITAAHDGDTEEILDFLENTQNESQVILSKKYNQIILNKIAELEIYLTETKRKCDLSESELAEEEHNLTNKLEELLTSFNKDREKFNYQIFEIVDGIKSDVLSALHSEEAKLISAAMHGSNINEKLNVIIRGAVTNGINKRFIPKVERYLKHISKNLNGDSIGNVQVSFNINSNFSKNDSTANILASIGAILIGGPIIGGIVAMFMHNANKKKEEQQRREAKRQIQCDLNNNVFPQVLDQVGKGLEEVLKKEIDNINDSIEKKIRNQADILTKSIEDVKKRIEEESVSKTALLSKIEKDLEQLQIIKYKIQ